ncbi:PLP-dependent aminotransferase family protein (plasmid) [Vibrio europaeus]|uniref:PLP-dependent aminotransferase family protein n=1 Tax=Vibrio europaeus TaxID=300876 RepID=A0AAE7B076_9VIBR|nr:PLP-dependent aminotransferase family protein [Vibrio europaeus]QJY38194.1 PLP-dependent aminotransferase family protein [Vibrio europaeus]
MQLTQSQLTSLAHPALDVMNFLNEVIEQYPEATSFASGRPSEDFFDVAKVSDYVEHYARYRAVQQGSTLKAVYQKLGQYGPTQGIICDVLAQHVLKEEGISVAPEHILVTDGAQEGMALFLLALFDAAKDVLLVTDPAYIGIVGMASVLGIEVCAVAMDDEGPDLADLEAVIAEIQGRGKTARGLYVVPEYSNPLGVSFSRARRKQLVASCGAQQVLILEDNPYGMFRYTEQGLPSLKSLDTEGCVIYLGTFAKSLCPSLRVGYLVIDQQVRDHERTTPLITSFVKVKSFNTLNTSQLNQATVAGVLLSEDHTLASFVAPAKRHYQRNRDEMLRCLEQHFSELKETYKVSWNQPEGGFFLVIDLPVAFTQQECAECADKFKVICVPLAFFSGTEVYKKQLRLSFSYVAEKDIEAGIKNLAQYLKILIMRSTGDA